MESSLMVASQANLDTVSRTEPFWWTWDDCCPLRYWTCSSPPFHLWSSSSKVSIWNLLHILDSTLCYLFGSVGLCSFILKASEKGASLEAIPVTCVLPIYSKAHGIIFKRGLCLQCTLTWLKPMLIPIHSVLVLHVR